MFTVYLVDDEKWTLVDIEQSFPFRDNGFEVIGQNTNPCTAYLDILQLHPDVVFTDIKMPGLSGLELIEKVKESYSNICFVVLSGYSEFEYVRGALRLGAIDYCLKPINTEDASRLLHDLKLILLQDDFENDIPKQGSYIGNEQFTNLLHYVDNHITENLVLGDLASQFYINVSYCGELFKKATGDNFIQYVRKKRMHMACSLLESTNLPVSQIASQTGYSDLPYFSRLFTEQNGISPSQYRKQKRIK